MVIKGLHLLSAVEVQQVWVFSPANPVSSSESNMMPWPLPGYSQPALPLPCFRVTSSLGMAPPTLPCCGEKHVLEVCSKALLTA